MAERYRPMAFAIETPRLSLRLRGPADAEWNLELLGERDGGTTQTLAEVQQRIAAQNVQAHENGFGFLAIQRREEADVIGYCGLLVGRASFDEPEIAYELLRRAHGHGYATEAGQAALRYVFDVLGQPEIVAVTMALNLRSQAVMRRIGMTTHPAEDYDDPDVEESPLRRHVVYRKQRTP